MPENFDHTWAEAHHLMVTVDANQDDLLTKAATNLKFIFFKGTLLEKVSSFPVPSRDVTYQTLPGRELFNYSLARECLVSDIPAEDGKTVNLVLQCRVCKHV